MNVDRTVVEFARRVTELQYAIPCAECGAVVGQKCATRGHPHPSRVAAIAAAFQLGADYARFRR